MCIYVNEKTNITNIRNIPPNLNNFLNKRHFPTRKNIISPSGVRQNS